MRRAAGTLWLALALVLTLAGEGCRWFRRAPRTAPVSAPAQPPAAPASGTPATTAPPEPEMAPPPQLPPGQPDLSQRPPVELPQPKPLPPQRRTRPASKPVTEPPAEPAAEAPRAPAPLPQLRQIITPEQEREANRVIDQCVLRVQRVLAAFQGRRLTQEQATSIARMRDFLQQAQRMRKSDLLAARALAERAAVLADDLLKTIP